MTPLLVLATFVLMGIVFQELFVRLGVLGDVRRVMRVAPNAVRVIRSAEMSDLEKERTVRRMSVEVLRDTLGFTVKLALILGACVAVAALAQALFGLSPDGLSGLLATWWALAALVLVMPLYAKLRARGGRAAGPPPADGADGRV